MAERVDDLVIGISGDFDDDAFRKAIGAIEKLEGKTSTAFGAIETKAKDVKKTYNSFANGLSTESKTVKNAATVLKKSIEQIDKAREAFLKKKIERSEKASSIPGLRTKKDIAEKTYAGYINDLLSKETGGLQKHKIDKDGTVYTVGSGGKYQEDLTKTAQLIKKYNELQSSVEKLLKAEEELKNLDSEMRKSRYAYGRVVGEAAKAINTAASAELEYREQIKARQAAEELATQEKLRIAQEKQATKEALQAEKQAAKEKQALIKQIEASEARLLKEQQAREKQRNSIIQTATSKAIGIVQKAYRKLKSINFGQIIAKFYSFVSVAKFLNSFVEASSEWIENLNLLEVVYNDTADSAENIKNRISELSKQFRLDVNALAKYVSVFKQMANAMGQTAEVGTQMSEVLSLVALDVSSLRNVSTEQAVSDLTGALAGQVKPVRKYGFDITMYSIEELMREVGFSGNARTMSQSNKQLARAILLVRQSKDAWGDFSKTINTYANQQRVLNDQITQFKRLLGNVLLGSFKLTDSFEQASETAGPLQQAIWYLNGALIAVNTVLEAMIPSIDNVNGAIASGAEDAIDALEEEEEAINGTLASFDKFNALQSNDSANNSASASLEALFSKESAAYMEEFTSRLAAINMYAEEISQTILEILYPDFEEWKKANPKGTFQEWSATIEDFKKDAGGLKETLLSFIKVIAFAANPLLGVFTTLGLEIVGLGGEEQKQALRDMIELVEMLGETFTNIATTLVKVFDALGPVLLAMIQFIGFCAETPVTLFMLIAAVMALAAAFALAKAAITAPELNVALLQTAKFVAVGGALVGLAAAGIGGAVGYINKHADGGFQTGGFFLAGESGPEWVGRQGNTATILNDNQMSDIMMDSVAKGVIKANMATRQMGGAQKSGGKVAVVNINGKHLFDVVEKEGYKEGKVFAKSR